MRMYVWKYYEPERLHFLKDLKLRFTPAGTFNDPFEVVPYIAEILPDEARNEYIQERQGENQNAYEDALRQNLADHQITLEGLDRLLQFVGVPATAHDLLVPADINERVAHMANEMLLEAPRKLEHTFGPSFQSKFGERFGVLCLSANPAKPPNVGSLCQESSGVRCGV